MIVWPTLAHRTPTEYEQSVVPWMEGSMVPRCPECAAKFGLTRRRHHCRLCGAVICNECSLGLDVGATGVFFSSSNNNSSNSNSNSNNGIRGKHKHKNDPLVLNFKSACLLFSAFFCILQQR